MQPKNRLIVAIDDYGDTGPGKEHHPLVRQLAGRVGGFKIGSSLFDIFGIIGGQYGVYTIDGPLFIDFKWFEPLDTMRRLGRSIVEKIDPDFCTVHARGGTAMMRAFREGRAEAAGKYAQEVDSVIDWRSAKLLGVTVLTSENFEALVAQGLVCPFYEFPDRPLRTGMNMLEYEEDEIKNCVLRLAADTQTAGLDGVVAPARFARAIRERCEPSFIIASPDIRFEESPPHNHVAPMTPETAIATGVDIIIMGRPITEAADPVAVAQRVIAGIERGLAAKERSS